MPLHFGQWNPQQLDKAKWQQLKKFMLQHDLKLYHQENMMPIIIDPKFVDATCVCKTAIDGASAPLLQLSQEGKEAGKLFLAGGHHQYQAVCSICEDKKKEVSKLKGQISWKEGKEVKTDAAKQKLNEEIKSLRKELAAVEEVLGPLGLWGIMLYDEKKMLANHERLANVISRNEEIKKYVEGDAEKAYMEAQAFLGKWANSLSDANAYAATLWNKSHLPISQILLAEETRDYLVVMCKLPHLKYTKPSGVKWIQKHLRKVTGGVICRLTEHMGNIFQSMVSVTPPPSLPLLHDINFLNQYLDQVGNNSLEPKMKEQ
ncbi:hypothetical protein APHAL10511_008607 [Amanita phalloides]|nr:hypothetical protein APHAL10511_008607 [Amanita phalloides]